MYMVSVVTGMKDNIASGLISIRTQYPGVNQEMLRQTCLQADCNTLIISYCHSEYI